MATYLGGRWRDPQTGRFVTTKEEASYASDFFNSLHPMTDYKYGDEEYDHIDTTYDDTLKKKYIKHIKTYESSKPGENVAEANMTDGSQDWWNYKDWNSSWVTFSGYDGSFATIGFVSGFEGDYQMSEDEYKSFYDASSKGKWLWAHPGIMHGYVGASAKSPKESNLPKGDVSKIEISDLLGMLQ